MKGEFSFLTSQKNVLSMNILQHIRETTIIGAPPSKCIQQICQHQDTVKCVSHTL
jgi:hypothetical protein